MRKLLWFAGKCHFAKKKEITIKNIFNQSVIAEYTSPNDTELTNLVEKMGEIKKNWLMLKEEKRKQMMDNFYNAISSEQFGQSISRILSQSTGKQLLECESEARVAVKILKHHLNHSYRKVRYFKGESTPQDFYSLEPFDCLLSVFDHRYPLLASVKYLGLALHSSNPLILRPSYYALPAVKEIQKLWNDSCDIKMIQTLIDPYLDPKNDNSPVKNLLQATEGFVSFDGKMKDGFDFHFYMNKTSPVLRENQFLLTSSDSAYVMNDLSASQLEKAASLIARGVFSNCGHNFNSIKRVFVDREIGTRFVELLVKQADKYHPKENISEVNQGLLAPFLIYDQFTTGMKKIEELRQKHSDELKLILGGDSKQITIKDHTQHYILPTIFQVTADFTNYNYQNEQFLMPICFVAFVDSPYDCIEKINSSIFGTTASIFTSDNRYEAIEPIGKKLDVGTVNVNTWQVTDGITYSGRKRSGKGFSFSPMSFNNIVRTKSVSYS